MVPHACNPKKSKRTHDVEVKKGSPGIDVRITGNVHKGTSGTMEIFFIFFWAVVTLEYEMSKCIELKTYTVYFILC